MVTVHRDTCSRLVAVELFIVAETKRKGENERKKREGKENTRKVF